jgi:hypothetical protein
VVISAAGLLVVVFVIAAVITCVELLRATYAFRRALIRCGDIPPDRNRPKLSQQLRQIAKLFRPHADLEAENARMRIIRAYQIWLLLMFLWMASFLALLIVQGPS